MRSSRLIATLSAAVALGAAGSASADTYCVGSPAACPDGATTSTDVQAGLDAAGAHPGHDVVMIGSGTFTSATGFAYGTLNAQNTVEIVGEGAATVLAADTAAKAGGFKVLFLSAPAPSTVSDMKVLVPNATDQAAKPTGIEMRGGVDVESLEITDSGALTLGADLGIALSGGDVRDTTVHLNDNADGINAGGNVPMTIADSDVHAERGIITVAGGDVTVRRSRIVGQDGGILMRGGTLRAESTLIRGTGSSGYGVRVQGYGASVPVTQADLSHVTLVGTAAPNTSAIEVKALDDGDAAVNVDNSIISGFGHGINRVSTDVGGEGEASLTAANINYDPTADVSQGSGQLIVNDASNVSPGFRDAANGDFSIGAASAMVDKGRSDSFVALDGGDLAGLTRSAGAQRDLGAYEYQATPPVASISGASPSITVGDAMPLSGAQSSADGDPGEQIVSWEWSFGDGTTATGADGTHAWTQAGTYEVALTVVDSGGQSHTATVDVVVTAKAVVATPGGGGTTGGGETTTGTGGGETTGGGGETTGTGGGETGGGTGGGGGGGGETPGTGGGTPDTLAPAISALTRRGRTVRLSLSEAASVTLRVERRRGTRFRAASAPKAVAGRAGANVLRIAKLRPGRYRLVVTATDAAGNRSVERLAFRVA